MKKDCKDYAEIYAEYCALDSLNMVLAVLLGVSSILNVVLIFALASM